MATIGELNILLRTKGLRTVTKDLNSVQRTIGRVQRSIAAFAAVFVFRQLIRGVSGAIKKFSEFETNVARVGTLMGRTIDEMREFQDGIVALSIETGEPIDKLTDGLFDIISATIDAAVAMDVLKASAELARGGFATVDDTTKALITVFQTFKGEIKDAADASDFLFAVQKRGRLTVADVANSIGVAASNAKVAKVSLEDFGAAFAAISRSGIGARNSITQLNAFMEAFAKLSDQAIEKAAGFGVEINRQTLAQEGLVKTVEKFIGLSSEQIRVIFQDRRARRGVNNLILRSMSLLKTQYLS